MISIYLYLRIRNWQLIALMNFFWGGGRSQTITDTKLPKQFKSVITFLVLSKQESIPVGYVPSAAVAIGVGGVCLPGGVYPSACWDTCQGGVCPSTCWDTCQGVCLPQCMLGYLPRGVCPSTCVPVHSPPPRGQNS